MFSGRLFDIVELEITGIRKGQKRLFAHDMDIFFGAEDNDWTYSRVRVNTSTARPGCWSGYISDSYCSLKPLWSGMGEVVPARTSPPLHPPSPPTVL